jgi:hypothetical protein
MNQSPQATLESRTRIRYDDLLSAFEWVSAAAPFQNSAFISRQTGSTYWSSSSHEFEDELPEDIDDATLYVAVPHKYDLDLGKDLVLRFADEVLPKSSDTITAFFLRRGAYARFKDFLEGKGCLQTWYDYEKTVTQAALREWCEENGLQLMP